MARPLVLHEDRLWLNQAFAKLLAEHRMTMDEAHEVAFELAYNLAKRAYRLDGNASRARSA